MQICTACTTKQTHGTIILENVEHCEDKPEQAGTGYYVTDEQSVNHPPKCTPIYYSLGALKVFLLCWLENSQVAKSSPEIAKYHICQLFLQPGQLLWLHTHGLSFTMKS